MSSELEGSGRGEQGFVFSALGAALVDDGGTVVAWSERAEQLSGLSADAVCGRSFADLVAGAEAAAGPGRGGVVSGRVRLRSAAGGLVPADVETLPLAGTGGQSIVLFAAARSTDEWGYGVSLVRAFLRQHRLGIVVHGRDLKVQPSPTSPRTCSVGRASGLVSVLRMSPPSGAPGRWRRCCAR